LDGFQNPQTPLALNHTLSLPYSGQRVGVDGILIPNGTILPNQPGSVNDFWTKPKQIGASFNDPEIQGNCGTGCAGYDTCYLVNRAQNGPYDWEKSGPVSTLSSAFTGIRVDTYSDQDAFQIYTCSGQNGTNKPSVKLYQ
jgi:aldose 1-epimerase